MAAKANIYIDRNTDFAVDLELFDDSGAPFDSRYNNFYASIKKLYSAQSEANFTIAKADGSITLSLDSTITRNLTPGKYQYDVLMTDEDGDVFKIVEGIAYIESTISTIPTE